MDEKGSKTFKNFVERLRVKCSKFGMKCLLLGLIFCLVCCMARALLVWHVVRLEFCLSFSVLCG